MTEHGVDPLRRHFLIRPSEVEALCTAIRRLAAGPLAEAAIADLRAAHREAVGRRPGAAAFRFTAPAGAERLIIVAAIRVRRNAGGFFTVASTAATAGAPPRV